MLLPKSIDLALYFLFPVLAIISVRMMHKKSSAEFGSTLNFFRIVSNYIKYCNNHEEFPICFLQLNAQIIMSIIFLMKTVYSAGVIIFISVYVILTLIIFAAYIKKKNNTETIIQLKKDYNITSCPYCGNENVTCFDAVCPKCKNRLQSEEN